MHYPPAKITTLIIAIASAGSLVAQNVGIGTNTPLQKLHIAGNTFVKDSLSIGIDSAKAVLDVKGTVLFRGDNTNSFTSTSASQAGVEFGTGRGYYTIPAPGVNKGDIALSYGGPGGGYRHFITSFHSPENGGYFYNGINLYINSSLTPEGSISPGYGNNLAMTLTNTGLGIGTSLPSAKLHINGNSILGGKTVIGNGNYSYIYNSTAELEVNGPALFKGGNPALTYLLSYPKAGVEFLFGRNANGVLVNGYSNPDLAFNYGDYEGGFRHFISTRHENVVNTTGNAFDFYVNNSVYRDSSVAPGTGNKLMLSVTAAGIGIGKATPVKALDVTGSGEVSGDFIVNRALKTDTISAAARLNIQGNATVTGKLTLNDSLFVNRGLRTDTISSASKLNIQSDTKITGKFTVSDSLLVSRILKTDSISTASRLNIQGNTRVTGKLTVSDSLLVSNTKITGKLTVTDSLFVNIINPENIQAAPLQNSWVNHGGGFTDAGFWKDKEGIVHIHGLIKNGNTAISTVLFTLPPGYRPPARQIYTVLSNNAVSRIDILGNGDVIIANTVSSLWLNLTGIYFRVN